MNKKITNHYFSHDCNARSDEKIIKLRAKYGAEGYGLYWMIAELLYQSDGYLDINYDAIAYELHCDAGKIESIINDFDLFKINDKTHKFYAPTLLKRIKLISEKSLKAKQSARARWAKESQKKKHANALRTQSDSNANKIKENKINNSNTYTREFENFWKLYPRSDSKFPAFKAWKKMTDSEKQQALNALPAHCKTKQWSEDKVIPYASTWLDQRRYEDEIEKQYTKNHKRWVGNCYDLINKNCACDVHIYPDNTIKCTNGHVLNTETKAYKYLIDKYK